MRNDKAAGGAIAGLLSKYRRVITFAGVGVLNTAVDYAAFSAAHGLFSAGLELSQTIGYFTGLINSFVFNRRFTFKRGATTGLSSQVVRFAAVNGITYLISLLFIRLFGVVLGLNPYLAKLITTVLVMAVNYLGYKILVFGVKDRPGEDAGE